MRKRRENKRRKRDHDRHQEASVNMKTAITKYQKKTLEKFFDIMSWQKFGKKDTKSKNHKRKTCKLNFIKLKLSILQQTLLRKLKTKQQ